MSQTFICYNYNVEIFEEGGFYNIIVRFPNGKALTAYSIEKDDPELILRPLDEYKDLRECIYKHIALEPQMNVKDKVIPVKEASETIAETAPKAEERAEAKPEEKAETTTKAEDKPAEEATPKVMEMPKIEVVKAPVLEFKAVTEKATEDSYQILVMLDGKAKLVLFFYLIKGKLKIMLKNLEKEEPSETTDCYVNDISKASSGCYSSLNLILGKLKEKLGLEFFDINRAVEEVSKNLELWESAIAKAKMEYFIRKQEEAPKGIKGNELRRLNDSEKLKLINLLEGVYKPGARQYIWLFLSGWGAKAGIDPVSIAEVLKAVYEKENDEEPLSLRAGAIVYSYMKAGISLEQYASEFEKLLGVKPYGLENEINEDEIKGKTGIQEVIESVVGEEAKALQIFKEMEEVFNSASPYRDAIIELLDYEKQLYAVANLRKLIVSRARKDNDRLVYKEKVFVGAPTEIVVYVNPIGGITKYQVKWEAPTRTRPIILGPTLLESVTDRLRAEGLVLNSRLASDVLSAVVNGFIRRGKAQMKEEIESPGFYFVDGKLIAVKYEAKEPSAEELKEALLLFNELAKNWFKDMIDRFAPAVKWGSIAPFIYAYKQKGKWVRYEYHFGSSYTGKTTLGIIVLKMWGLREEEANKPGASLDSPARLGYAISKSTFPIVIREPGGMLSKEEIVEMIKSSAEGLIARSIIQRGNQLDFPALAPLFFTSNTFLPRDDALLRRFSVRHYSYGERIPLEKAREFEKTVLPKLGELEAIGRFIANYTLKNGLQEDPENHATKVLSEAYKFVNLEVPEWLKYQIEETGSVSEYFEDTKELIRNFLVKRINEEFSKNIQKLVGEVYSTSGFQEGFYKKSEVDFVDRVLNVLDKQLIPWLIRKDETVYITSGFVKEIESLVGNTGGLKSLAELLGWEYNPKYTLRDGKSVKGLVVIRVDLEDFISFLNPTIEVQE